MKTAVLCLAAAAMAVAADASAEPGDSLQTKPVKLDEVVVSAIRVGASTPVAYSNLSREELRSRNDGQGIPSLIATAPSVVMTSDAGTGVGYASFRIRGTDQDRINITVDGVPLNDAESQDVFWVNMPDFASSLSGLQIQRGVGTSTNGAAAFGATVALQTAPSASAPGFSYDLSAGSYGTLKHTFDGSTGLMDGHFAIDARYSDVRSDGYIDRAWARMQSYYGQASWYGTNTLLRFRAFGSSERTYQAWDGVPAAKLAAGDRTYNDCGEYTDDQGKTAFYPNQTDNYWQQHYHLLASQRFGRQWNANLTLHYTHGDGYYEEYKSGMAYADFNLPDYTAPDGSMQATTDLVRRKWLDNDFYGGIFSANYKGGSLALTFGGALNNYVGAHYGRLMWTKSGYDLPAPDYEYYRNTGRKLDGSVYAKANWRFLPHLSAYADLQYRGLRYSICGDDDVAGKGLDILRRWNFFNPKAGLDYTCGPHRAFASFGVAHREPNRDNFTDNGPDASPTDETLFDYEAGYSWQKDGLHLSLGLYYMDYRNQLVLTGKISQIGEQLTSNIPDSDREGLELGAAWRICRLLSWSGNLTLSRNRIRNFTEYVDDDDTGGQQAFFLGSTDIAFSPDLTGSSLFHFTWRDLSADFTSQYVARQYLDNTTSRARSLDPYFVNSLRLGYVFHPRFVREANLGLTVYNLFNEQYETNGWVYSYIQGGQRCQDGGYFTQAPIHFMFRLGFKI
ncbi:MAG: TonB-dependent receptor [Tannerella sp.]|jgi:iron complex outermembrane receptor protein|nr:TonB-dependent receptor [Tannerella sp.]